MSIHTNPNGSCSSGSNSNAINTAENKIKMVIDKPNQFPWKLYDMLDTAEKRGEEHIISWIREGTAFKVHNREVFIEAYMKKQFNQTKFKSFQRQLNLWGFERIQTGPDKGSYFHPLFLRGQRQCCQRLTRVRLKGAPVSDTKHTGINMGVDASNQDSKLPATLAGRGAGISVAAGGTAAGYIGNPSVAAPIHGFTGPDPTHISAIEATLRGSSQQQIADLLRYQQESQHRETLAAAAAGLGPDVASLVVPNAPLYPTTIDRSTLVVNGLLQHQREVAQQRQQQQQEEERRQRGLTDQQSRIEQSQQEEIKMTPSSIPQPEQILQAPVPNGNDLSTNPSNHSDEMAALLAVSAQRRREEELALLLELSKPNQGVDV